MSTAFYVGHELRKYFESLPPDETDHMRRVGLLVYILTSNICHSDSYIGDTDHDTPNYFAVAATFHDIGKAFVPSILLTKPDKLTEKETTAMRKHPEHAKRMFIQLKNNSATSTQKHLLSFSFDSAVYHHEWWNGEGYPYGIEGKKIPFIARITSVCDAYDAITSKRVYRGAHTHDYACHELQIKSGTQFDPQLIQVFLNNERAFAALQNHMISFI